MTEGPAHRTRGRRLADGALNLALIAMALLIWALVGSMLTIGVLTSVV